MPGAAEALPTEFELGAAGAGLLVGGLSPGTAAVAGVTATAKFAPHWSPGPSAAAIGSSPAGGRFSKWISALRAVNALKVGVKNGSRSRPYEA